MIAGLAKSIFGSANDRYVRGLGKYVDAINGFEPTISALTDDELKGQTEIFRRRLAEGTRLDDLDRKSTRLNSSHVEISYAVFCLKKKKTTPAMTYRLLASCISTADAGCAAALVPNRPAQ